MKKLTRNYSLSSYNQVSVTQVSSSQSKALRTRDKYTSQSPFAGESFEVSLLKVAKKKPK